MKRFAIIAFIFALGLGSGAAIAYQPHMNTALSDLNAAVGQLQAATANKGGHRLQAITLVNQAIVQVQAGIAAGS
jgi:hypothetical protein